MMYLVHKHTKEHLRYSDAMEWPDADCFVVDGDADGWIAWQGGPCPLPIGQLCDVKHWDGEICPRVPAGVAAAPPRNDAELWDRKGNTGDIIAYRPILAAEAKPEPPAWGGEGKPPVGVECEYRLPHGWECAKVIGYDGPACVVAVDGEGYLGNDSPGAFRPICSEKDRAVSKLMEDAELMRAQAERVIDAGYRKHD